MSIRFVAARADFKMWMPERDVAFVQTSRDTVLRQSRRALYAGGQNSTSNSARESANGLSFAAHGELVADPHRRNGALSQMS